MKQLGKLMRAFPDEDCEIVQMSSGGVREVRVRVGNHWCRRLVPYMWDDHDTFLDLTVDEAIQRVQRHMELAGIGGRDGE